MANSPKRRHGSSHRKYMKRIPLFTIPFKIYHGFKYYSPKIFSVVKWSFKSRELGTFTYALTHNNVEYLLQSVSIITSLPYEKVAAYYDELNRDAELKSYVIGKTGQSEYRYIKDRRCDFGSRMAYYCIIRAMKPGIVVENGVELGYTAVVLCAALLKNLEEGYPGKYYGFDFDPEAGLLINDERFKDIAHIIEGESLNSLSVFEHPIDFYFSDGERSLDYETREFELLKIKMSKTGILVSNKLHLSNAASRFAIETGKKLIYFREDPLDHWFPGSHIGFVFNHSAFIQER